jgi:hypothetical protein
MARYGRRRPMGSFLMLPNNLLPHRTFQEILTSQRYHKALDVQGGLDDGKRVGGIEASKTSSFANAGLPGFDHVFFGLVRKAQSTISIFRH